MILKNGVIADMSKEEEMGELITDDGEPLELGEPDRIIAIRSVKCDEQMLKAAYERGLKDGAPTWVSVKERLPEIQGEVLVYSTSDPRLTVKTIPYLGKACFAIKSEQKWQLPNWQREFLTGFYIESIYCTEVTHWMALPPAPLMPEEAKEHE